VLGIRRLLPVESKLSPLLIPLVVAVATEGFSKLLIIGRSLLIEPGFFSSNPSWRLIEILAHRAILHEASCKR
jgi:hypothetical protein